MQLLEAHYQVKSPISCLKRAEVQELVCSLNPKKSLGYELINCKILKELSFLSYPVIQCYLAQMILPGTMEGRTDCHLEVMGTS
jgi:hypothetical protein